MHQKERITGQLNMIPVDDLSKDETNGELLDPDNKPNIWNFNPYSFLDLHQPCKMGFSIYRQTDMTVSWIQDEVERRFKV